MRFESSALLVVASMALATAGASVARADGPRYLVTAQGGAGFTLGTRLPDDVRTFTSSVGGAFGFRFMPASELHLEFAHSFIGTSSDAPGGSINQLGLRFDHSPAEFENAWFWQAGAGWVNSSVSPGFSADRLFVSAGAGYSFDLGKWLDLRPVVAIELAPVQSALGNQAWPIASVNVQIVSKMEEFSSFLLDLFNGFH